MSQLPINEWPGLRPQPDWTLFLDRDGVINRKLPDDYVKHWGEFDFLPGVLPALATLARHFATIIIATNQRGIGRGLMTEADLAEVHTRMLAEIGAAGGRIDRIFYAPDLAEEDYRGWRKPRTGMAMAARAALPQIDLTRSIMMGDSASDMVFGKDAGMRCVWVQTDQPAPPAKVARHVDAVYADLPAFARWVEQAAVTE